MGLLDFIAPGKQKRNQAQQSTQLYLRFAEIHDNVLVLKNGGLRAILRTSSVNFNLKSEDEQNSIIYSYQGFLNSLEFPIQILVRSKKLDIDDYIEQINALGEKQQNKLLQEQTYEYANYIKRLVEFADIMEKEFYVVIPYDPARTPASHLGLISKFQSFFQRLSPKDSYGDIKTRRNEFNNLKKGLTQRINIAKSGLENCGLKVDQLETMEIIELFYQSYNPVTCRTQKLKDLENTTVSSDEQKEEDKLASNLDREINRNLA